MSVTRYYFDDGKSRKFWSVKQRGKKVTSRSGKLDSPGKELVKEFDSSADAKAYATKQAASKLKKGYVEVDPTQLNFSKKGAPKKATETQIKKFEKLIGFKLPAEYRDFLATQNGGTHDKGSFDVTAHPSRYGYYAHAPSFYILNPKARQWENLEYAYKASSPILPEGQIPITDSGGNLVTIDVKSKPGCVYLFDHELPHHDWAALAGMDDPYVYTMKKDAILVAGTFCEFLTRIAVFVDEED